MISISALTVTLGRELYLRYLLKSIERSTGWADFDYTHQINFMGAGPSESFTKFADALKIRDRLTIKTTPVYSIGKNLEMFKENCKSDVFWKIDDDGLVLSPRFFSHMNAIFEFNPRAVYSPFPVGILNRSPLDSEKRTVYYSKTSDTYYVFREVKIIGGLSRIMPTELFKQVPYSDAHKTDMESRNWCKTNKIPMYYLENAMVVEHQETSLGQLKRYK